MLFLVLAAEGKTGLLFGAFIIGLFNCQELVSKIIAAISEVSTLMKVIVELNLRCIHPALCHYRLTPAPRRTAIHALVGLSMYMSSYHTGF